MLGFVKNPRLMALAERLARRQMRKQIPDPEFRKRLTPDFTIGCKRILPSNKWYPALVKDNVEVVTEGVKEVRRHSIVAEDGVERPIDAIIFGTGFEVTDMPVATQVRGRDGRLLGEVWDGSPRAHLGTAIAGFPNFFMMLGPNTGLGHSSMVYMAESQIAYVMDALRCMSERDLETVKIRAEAAEAYNERVEERMEGTVWNTGCASWYLDDTGRNATLWPDWTWRFRQRTRSFDPEEYLLEARRPAPAAAAVA